MSATRKADNDVELHSDAMKRFERAVDVVAKSPPQPKIKKKKAARNVKKKGRP